jgi:hypothetical protein
MASLVRYDSADRHRRMRRWAAIDRLASVEIQQFAEGTGVCPVCGTETYRLLDESKISLPLEGYVESLHSRQGRNVPFRVLLNNAYEATQDVVRSGLFSRDQLGDLHLTEHELEVAQGHFLTSRPVRCDCHFGSEPEYSEYELALLASQQVGEMTPMDAVFASTGVRPRTGFRRRSKSAIARRRQRFRESRACRTDAHVVPVIRYSIEALLQMRPNKVALRKLPQPKRRCRVKSVPPWVVRKRNSMAYVVPLLPPRKHHKKYWYFLRRRGYYYFSRHHPYGDERGYHGPRMVFTEP